MNHLFSLLFLWLLYLPALAQSARTGIALAQFPAWGAGAPISTAFSADSAVTLRRDGFYTKIIAAAEQPDGALQVLAAMNTGGGYTWTPDANTRDSLMLYSVRFSPEGRLDTTYDRSGWIPCALPFNDYIRNVRAALQTDGKWVVALDFTYNKDLVVMRFEPDGRLDTSFRQAGYVLFTNDGSKTDDLLDLSLFPDGKIALFASSRYEALDQDCRVIRLRPDGMRDTSFDRDGVLMLAERPWIGACRMLPDGRFVLLSHNLDWLRVERYLPDGRPDPDYGRLGKVYSRIGTINSDFLTLWPDGSLILHGYESTLCETGRPGSVFRSGRYDATGRPDTLSIVEPFTTLESATYRINDTTWMAFSSESAEVYEARFYNRQGVAQPHRLRFSGLFEGREQCVVSSSHGDAFILGARDGGLLAVARLLPNGHLHPAYGLDSAAIFAQGYTIRTTEQAGTTLMELRETNPKPQPYQVTVTPVQDYGTITFTTAMASWEFEGNKRPLDCYNLREIDAPYFAGKNLHLHLKNCLFPGDGADWSAVQAERLLGLSLSNCRFEGKIPAELRRFRQLQLLEIRYDSTLADSQQHLDEALRLIPFFPRLRCLVIHAPGMTAAPKSLKKLRDVVSLELNTPRLAQFPEAILRMKKLRRLRLTFQCPEGLPASIGHLDSLELLELTGAGPAARLQLPETLGRLHNLKELRLKDGARQSVLPVSAGALRQLEQFEMVNAGISTLPDSLGACSRLTEITIVSAGKFERLPERFLELPNLTRLQLEVCQPELYLRLQGERLRRLARERNMWFDIRLY